MLDFLAFKVVFHIRNCFMSFQKGPINVPPPTCHRCRAIMGWVGSEMYICDSCNTRDGVFVSTRRWARSVKEISSKRLETAGWTFAYSCIPLLFAPVVLGVDMAQGGIYWTIYFFLLSTALVFAYKFPVSRIVDEPFL